MMNKDQKYGFIQSTNFIRYCNSRLANSNDYNIARVLLMHLEHIYDLSLEDIAEEAHISTASVSRFINKAGFRTFADFKRCMESSFLKTKLRRMNVNSKKLFQISDQDFVDNLYNEGVNNLKKTRESINLNKIKEIISKLMSSRSVTFLGDLHELTIFYTLQLELIMHNIPVFSMQYDDLNLLHTQYLSKDDVLFFISVHDDWFTGIQKEILKKAKANGVYIIVLCQETKDFAQYDQIYRYGIEGSNNDGYYSLLYLNRIMCDLFYR